MWLICLHIILSCTIFRIFLSFRALLSTISFYWH
ncbi:MAG: hypothetical protein ACTIC8_00245, partial [Leuconostoc falkenbergense]